MLPSWELILRLILRIDLSLRATRVSGLIFFFRCIPDIRPIRTLRVTNIHIMAIHLVRDYIAQFGIKFIKISPWPRWCTTSDTVRCWCGTTIDTPEAVRHKAGTLVAGFVEGISGIKLS